MNCGWEIPLAKSICYENVLFTKTINSSTYLDESSSFQSAGEIKTLYSFSPDYDSP